MIETLISQLNRDFTIRTAYAVISTKHVVRVSRRFPYRARNRREEYVVTIGEPNYLAAKFIKACVAAKEPFPIKKIQFEKYPVKSKNGKTKG